MSGRRGHLLVEALCALALSGVLAATAALALSGVRRSVRAADLRAESVRGGRDALLVMTALLRDAEGVQVEAETAIVLSVRTGSSVVCARDSLSISIPPVPAVPGSVADPVTVRAQPIEWGDRVAVLMRDSVSGAVDWWRGEVDSVEVRRPAPGCGVAGGWIPLADSAQPGVRMFTSPLPPGVIEPGAPARIARQGRLSLYPSSGEWMLGWRRCVGTPPRCGVVQPVAGPLRTPGTGGLRVRPAGPPGGVALEVRVPGDATLLQSLVTLRAAP
ncbi:MAG: hypothetical protein JNL44_14030 [Gemmatimonadetes bacterium]|nr:hypothetical protein [Gemmatimonadota bacterium]